MKQNTYLQVSYVESGQENHILKMTQWEHPILGEVVDSEEGEQQSISRIFNDSSFDIDDYFNEDKCIINEKKEDLT